MIFISQDVVHASFMTSMQLVVLVAGWEWDDVGEPIRTNLTFLNFC